MKAKIIFYIFIFGIIAFPARAQEKWTVSDDEKALTNPLPITDDLIDQGQDLFVAKCQSCHGPAGKGKALPLVPDMKDLGNAAFLKSITAGEMFTKLSEGKGAMPGFKSQLSKEDRWKIIGFLRNIIGEKGSVKKKTSVATLAITDDEIDQGQDLFVSKCQSCHGPAGKGKALPLVPDMKDLGNAVFLKSVTADAMFAKVTDGKGAMPGFKSQLSKEDRWKIIHFLRSLIGERGTAAKTTANSSSSGNTEFSDLQLAISFDEASHSVNATLEGKDADGNINSASGIKVQVFVKRYFGNLLLATVKTSENGKFSVELPTDLPVSYVDSSLLVLAKVKKESKYGKVMQTLKVKWGAPNPHVNLLAHRALWATARMAPLWLIFIYVSVVSGVWIFIIYVLTLVAKINKAGKKEQAVN